MALTIGQKSERVLRFLRGLPLPRVASALAAHGFTQADWDEGWRLLQAATGEWLLREPLARPEDPTVIDELDAWENRWFPVAEATLRRRLPAVADRVFLNLTQTSGVEVTVSVSTFVERVRQLAKDGDSAGQEARTILNGRGLTDGVLAQAEALLKRFGLVQFSPPAPAAPGADPARRQAAEDALWGWYREWGTIARNSVQDGNLLRALGFLTPTGGKDDDGGDETEIDGGTGTSPIAGDGVTRSKPLTAAP
jgi:hypothetical protein